MTGSHGRGTTRPSLASEPPRTCSAGIRSRAGTTATRSASRACSRPPTCSATAATRASSTAPCKAWIPRAQPYREIDNTAPGYALCLLYERTGDEAVLAAAGELAALPHRRRTLGGVYVPFERAPLRSPMERALLTGRAAQAARRPRRRSVRRLPALRRAVPRPARPPRGDDASSSMRAPTRRSRLVALLQQPDGFVRPFLPRAHGQTYGHGWGRGQGWALLGLLDVLEQLPESHPHARGSAPRCVRLAGCARGDAGARWPLADADRGPLRASTRRRRPPSPRPASPRGLALGLLGDSARAAAQAAWERASPRSAPTARSTGVSAALWASTAPSHYAGAPVGFQVPWGAGPFLVAAREHLGPRAR